MERDARISFRADSAFQAGLAHSAEKAGCSVSEFIRQTVEERLVKDGGFNPYPKLAKAAKGDLDAQRYLANQAVDMAFLHDEGGEFINDPVQCLIEGLVFARLAAAHGHVADQGLVISMLGLLSQFGDEEDTKEIVAEAIARAENVAEMGGEESAVVDQWLLAVADASVPGTVELAKEMRKAMLAGEAAQ